MVSKMPNVSWPKGTFMEIVKGWQQQWFYVTEPRDTTWAAAPKFKSGAPMRLTSWLEKGLDWSSSDELTTLQTRIKSMVDKNIKLVNVIQVMLVRRILPCQQWDFTLWEFDPAQHQTLRRLFDTMYEDIWKALIKGVEAPASASEGRGYNSQCHASEVCHLHLLQDVKLFFIV